MARRSRNKRRQPARLAVSRLTLTIVIANTIGLLILFFGSFALNQYRDGLIDAKLQGVRAQAQIIADVLAQVAIDENSCKPVASSDIAAEADPQVSTCRLSLSRSDVREIFNRVWDSFEGRVRIFNAPQTFETPPVKDAQDLLLEDVVLRKDEITGTPLAPIEDKKSIADLDSVKGRLKAVLRSFTPDSAFRRAAKARTLEDELNEALTASPLANKPGAASVRYNEEGELVASVSIPVRKVQAVYGVVTAEIGGIEQTVEEARLAILPFFGLALAAAVLTSLLLTAAIAQPIRQLAIAADKVREGAAHASRARIPDFSNRRDEIGELSRALRAMTSALFDRMEAIESFAADVAHELKNPLTSIRSATETLDIVRTDEQRAKLMGLIKKDVGRMDRLITDISNASRVDAELARQTREPVDLAALLHDVTATYEPARKLGMAKVSCTDPVAPVFILGFPGALGQVFRNLIDNAVSFSPADGEVRVSVVRTDRGDAQVLVEDDGPGIPPENLETVFNRFYTKRPVGTDFGKNSGLGLAISKQIVEAHGGSIRAENRLADPDDPESARQGARFVVELIGA